MLFNIIIPLFLIYENDPRIYSNNITNVLKMEIISVSVQGCGGNSNNQSIVLRHGYNLNHMQIIIPVLRYSTPKGDFIKWANILYDEIRGVVWYCTKNLGIVLPSRFVTPVLWTWCLFTILIIWGKCVLHYLNLKIMKINNKVNIIRSYFLIMRKKPPNINISYKCADWM